MLCIYNCHIKEHNSGILKHWQQNSPERLYIASDKVSAKIEKVYSDMKFYLAHFSTFIKTTIYISQKIKTYWDTSIFPVLCSPKLNQCHQNGTLLKIIFSQTIYEPSRWQHRATLLVPCWLTCSSGTHSLWCWAVCPSGPAECQCTLHTRDGPHQFDPTWCQRGRLSPVEIGEGWT